MRPFPPKSSKFSGDFSQSALNVIDNGEIRRPSRPGERVEIDTDDALSERPQREGPVPVLEGNEANIGASDSPAVHIGSIRGQARDPRRRSYSQHLRYAGRVERPSDEVRPPCRSVEQIDLDAQRWEFVDYRSDLLGGQRCDVPVNT